MASPSSSSASDDESSRATTPDPEDVETYQTLMNSLFPSSSLPPPPIPLIGSTRENDGDEEDNDILENGVKRPMTKAEKQNAKKKRRKERERMAREEAERMVKGVAQVDKQDEHNTQVPFRLFSACPIKSISLIPESEEYPCPPNPRHLPWSAEKIERIRRIASESVIDPSSLDRSSSSHVPSIQGSCSRSSLMVDPTQNLNSLPEMFIGELPRYKSIINTVGSKDVPSRSSSQTTTTLYLKQTQGKSEITNKCKTRRGRRKKLPIQGRFWAPSPGIGGKARGYAWGYRDSMEGRREQGAWEGYVRSKDR